VFDNAWKTYPVFADFRAARLKKLSTKSDNPSDILPQRVRYEMEKYKEVAYEPTTKKNAKSAWKPWLLFMEECNVGSPFLDPDAADFDIYLAGFKAALASNLYGTDVHCSSSVQSYAAQVTWILRQHLEQTLSKTVTRGIDKELQDNRKFTDSIDLDFYAQLFKRRLQSADLAKVRDLLVYVFLGFGIQRAQAATHRPAAVKYASCAEAMNCSMRSRILTVDDVRLDWDNYAVWWGLRHSKGDPFGRRKGKDGRDWTPTAGCKSAKHPIDVVALYVHYCKLMGFTTQRHGRLFEKTKDVPFFQEIKKGKATGQPLLYDFGQPQEDCG
jgi:hypothetical protein